MKEFNKQYLVRNNPFDISQGSINKSKLAGSLNVIAAQYYSEIISELLLEIKKYREGHFEFIASEYEIIAKESDEKRKKQEAILVEYSNEQFMILDKIAKDLQSYVLKNIPNFQEILGKTELIAPLRSNKGNK
jgi:hypothetical protein